MALVFYLVFTSLQYVILGGKRNTTRPVKICCIATKHAITAKDSSRLFDLKFAG